MECAGDSNKSAKGIVQKTLQNIETTKAHASNSGGVSWQPSIILRTVLGTIFLAVQNVCRMLNYFLYHNTGCKVSRFLSHSKRKY